MRIGLVDLDKTWVNLALMKVANYFKLRGHEVDWCQPLTVNNFDEIYVSSVFSFNAAYGTKWVPIGDTVRVGGSGFNYNMLPDPIDDCKPDYSIYPDFEYATGFLTRGCIRNCNYCIVPQKEGDISAYRDINDVYEKDRPGVILLDNNILACDHGIKQIEKIAEKKIRVDFNQGLDARLIDDSVAKLLKKVKFLKPLRMACDNMDMVDPVFRAVQALRWQNVKPAQYFVYVLVKNVYTAREIVRFLKGIHVDPFAQNFRDRDGSYNPDNIPFVNWVNRKQHYRSCTYEDFEYANRREIMKHRKNGIDCRPLFEEGSGK